MGEISSGWPKGDRDRLIEVSFSIPFCNCYIEIWGIVYLLGIISCKRVLTFGPLG